MPLYVYGLMRAQDGARAVEALNGQPASRVLESVEHEGLCALVSSVAPGDLKLRRESALAHTDTLQAAFDHGPVLPVRFGTVLPDAAALERELLAPRATALLARLEALEHLTEMQVKVSYLEEQLLGSILAADPPLARRASRIRNLPPEATHFDRINLGEAIHQAVQVRREEDSRRLIDELSPLAVAVSVREPPHERAVLNASFLVARERLEAFDSEVERLSQEAAGTMSFRLIGPMPAHSFVEGQWEARAAHGSSQWA
ncbi:MAG: GvpL/GvpF family gas vesicle protein [Solirubrobacteraceae bacterium]